MSRLLAVAVRELRERFLLFPGAFVAGFLPLVVPAFGVSRGLVATMGVVAAVLLGAAAGVVIGSSMLARDTADGRLRFLFSRPLPWGTIWGGKWLAALVAASSCAALASIPWMVAVPFASLGGRHGDSWLQAMFDGPGASLLFTLIVLSVGLANFGATVLRSRSPWLVLDMLLLLGAFWATRRYVAPLWLYDIVPGWNLGPQIVTLGLVPLALAGLVGSMVQVAVGRTDLRRAHSALSLGFWAVIGLALAGAAGYWGWVRSTSPDGLRVDSVSRDPAGRWIYVEGSGRYSGMYPHYFLLDTATGRYVARPGGDEEHQLLGSAMLFSADGRFGALPAAAGGRAALTLVELRESAPRVTQLLLESSPPPVWMKTSFALSPAAASVFVVHESGASFHALPGGRRLATTTIPPGWRPAAVRYLAEDRARAWLVPADDAGAGRARPEMRVVDLATDGTSSGVTFPVGAPIDPVIGWRAVLPDRSGRRILTWDGGLRLRDGASGQLIATLVEGGASGFRLFLADGRIVVDGHAGDVSAQPRLRLFDQDAARLADVELPLPPCPLGLGPEVAPGRLAVWCSNTFLSRDTLVVDVATGAVVDTLSGLQPAFAVTGVSGASKTTTSVHFFRSDAGPKVGRENQIVRIDFATGERKVVAGAGATRGERISAR